MHVNGLQWLKNPFQGMKFAKTTPLIVVFTIFGYTLFAQGASQDSITKKETLNKGNHYTQWVSFAHINDLFRLDGVSDRYFSFGHQLDYLRNIKSNKKEDRSLYYTIGLNFEGYTPEYDLEIIDSSTTRPFAAWSYITLGFTDNKPNRYLKYEFEVGYIGPKARGKEIQNWVHKQISKNPEVIGWSEQIDNQIGINFSLDYRKTIIQTGKHTLLAGSEQKLGNVYTFLWPSISYQFNGKAKNGYLPFQYAASGSSNFTVEANIGFKYEFFNITIEGEPSSEIFEPLKDEVIYSGLFTAGLGVRYHFRNFSIYFSNNYNSKRVQSNHDHIYGVMGLSYSW